MNKIKLLLILSLTLAVIPRLCLSATSVTQFGIKWTFNGDYQTGRFANGDYWVVGPVTITGINPPSQNIGGRIMHGSMINPSPVNGSSQGYDNTMYGGYGDNYTPELNVSLGVSAANPLTVPVESSLVSTISNPEEGHRPQLLTCAILTVLNAPVPVGSFRPPYTNLPKDIKFNKSQLNYSLLSKLEPVDRTPRLKQEEGDNRGDSAERMFERPWIDHVPGWVGRYIHPSENMQDYGRDIAGYVSIGALMLHLNFTNQEKETLMIRYTQVGIDMYGVLQDNGTHVWPENGGHGSGRKWPIIFAGLVLNDPDMKAIGQKSGDYLYANGFDTPQNHPDDYIHFGEDDQTFYVKETDIYSTPYEMTMTSDWTTGSTGNAKVVYGSMGIEGVNTKWMDENISGFWFGIEGDEEAYRVDGKAYKIDMVIDNTHLKLTEAYRGSTDLTGTKVYKAGNRFVWYGHGNPIKRLEYKEYTQKHLGMPEWGISHVRQPYIDGLNWYASYRRCCNANAWSGFILAAHLMDAKALWNHNALFDYQDRYMLVEEEIGNKGNWTRGWSDFYENMWDTYRIDAAPAWSYDDLYIYIGDETEIVTEDSSALESSFLTIFNNVLKPRENKPAVIRISGIVTDKLKISVYSSKGKEIKTIYEGPSDGSSRDFYWSGDDSSGRTVGSGIYIVYMKSDGNNETKKIAVVK